MTETLTTAPPQHEDQAQPEIQAFAPGASREIVLRKLLPYDYDYARDNGLIDMFYYNQQTGEDGLLHTLSGSIRPGEEGAFIAEGFHHEPSAEAAWPRVIDDRGVRPTTRVDRAHLESAPSNERAKYREFPLEPYQARVAVNGLVKVALHKDPETGKTKFAVAKNSMFPKEYDALAVMQTISQAYQNREAESDYAAQDAHGRDVIVTKGSALLMDGESRMSVSMVLDRETGKIVSAMPLTKRKPGIMKLSPEQADELINNF